LPSLNRYKGRRRAPLAALIAADRADPAARAVHRARTPQRPRRQRPSFR